MKAIEIARRLVELKAVEEACQAYTLVLHESNGEDFSAEMEAAAYLMEFGKGDDYKVAYTYFQRLYNHNVFRDTVFDIMTEAFYTPNVKLQKSRYEKNTKLLGKYPYIFRRDFPKFDDLPLRFYPFDDDGFLPFDPEKEHFGDYINYNNQVISRNFFGDLENPVLATDVFSQYELEYLNDNVRPSEWVARENHIYLHYTSWEEFCAHLCVLNLRPLLGDKKFVFLIGDEIAQYPIDFKERFGIDYSQYTVKPVGIREVNKIIWHTQLSSHNGGDFFNEVFDSHPNLLAMTSIMLFSMEESIEETRKSMESLTDRRKLAEGTWKNLRVTEELYSLRDRTDKDIMVASYLQMQENLPVKADAASRIAPAIFFQPHFYNINYRMDIDGKNHTTLVSSEYDKIRALPMLREFKYIKTFTPLRRFTTSYGATVNFMLNADLSKYGVEKDDKSAHIVGDVIFTRIVNRSFMVDWQDRLFKDCVLVRFEDGKLNPKATFKALAAFLDIPYAKSMESCTQDGKPLADDIGFSTAGVYRTYDEYANDRERAFIEYFMRDAYECYGYDFKYYKNEPVDEERAQQWVQEFSTLDRLIRESWEKAFESPDALDILELCSIAPSGMEGAALGEDKIVNLDEVKKAFLNSSEGPKMIMESHMAGIQAKRERNVQLLLRGLQYVNRNGQPLRMMPKLELDPELLEQPLYH